MGTKQGAARRGAGAQGRWLQVNSGQKEGAAQLGGAEFGVLERREGRGETGRVSGLGAPLPSRLSGQGSRPGRSAGPGRLSSFLGSDPGVRAAPPPTAMEADTATATVALHRNWSWIKPGLTEAGLSPAAFRLLHTGSPLRLQRLVQDRWLSAVRPETSARFRPERVGGDTLAAPGPPPARRGRPRPVPPRPSPPRPASQQPRPQGRSRAAASLALARRVTPRVLGSRPPAPGLKQF